MKFMYQKIRELSILSGIGWITDPEDEFCNQDGARKFAALIAVRAFVLGVFITGLVWLLFTL